MFSRWKKPPQPFALDEPVLEQDLTFYEALGFDETTVFACYLGEDYVELHGEPALEKYLK